MLSEIEVHLNVIQSEINQLFNIFWIGASDRTHLGSHYNNE